MREHPPRWNPMSPESPAVVRYPPSAWAGETGFRVTGGVPAVRRGAEPSRDLVETRAAGTGPGRRSGPYPERSRGAARRSRFRCANGKLTKAAGRLG